MDCQLSIVIVNWNCIGLLPRCLDSIARWHPGVPFEVIVVDNVSTDGSLEWLRSPGARSGFADGQFRLIENTTNVGFGRANNRAIASSRSELVFLLNPDTEVRRGAIDALVALLREDHRIGACAPRLLNPDGSLQPSVSRTPLRLSSSCLKGSSSIDSSLSRYEASSFYRITGRMRIGAESRASAALLSWSDGK